MDIGERKPEGLNVSLNPFNANDYPIYRILVMNVTFQVSNISCVPDFLDEWQDDICMRRRHQGIRNYERPTTNSAAASHELVRTDLVTRT